MLSFVYDHAGTMRYVEEFLAKAGIQAMDKYVSLENAPDSMESRANDVDAAAVDERVDVDVAAHDDTAFISGDDLSSVSSMRAPVRSDMDVDPDSAARFGQVLDLSFLGDLGTAQRKRKQSHPTFDSSAPSKDQAAGALQQERAARARKKDDDRSLPIQAAGEESEEASFNDESSRDADSDYDD